MSDLYDKINYKYIKPYLFVMLVIIAFLTAEIVCRIKYFLIHNKEWNYITAPFLIHPWNGLCKNKKVYNNRYKKLMDITYDDNCFRGDKVSFKKTASEFRIFILGDSTVDSQQPDSEIWTNQMKLYLSEVYKNKKVKVVNAGSSGFESRKIKSLYENKIRYFAPDLTLFYAAANEGVEFTPFANTYRSIEKIQNTIHKVFYYNSMLYTYLCEKIIFSISKNKKYFWIIDLISLKNNFLDLNSKCLKSGSKLIFITQAMNFPRFYKGIDTFNYKDILGRLKSMQSDSENSAFNSEEIIMFNQRIAIFYLIEICEQYDIPYINILTEVEKLDSNKRAAMFLDFIHQSPEGDNILGELIGRKLSNLLKQL